MKSISTMVSCLGSEFNFKIITRDRDKRAELPYKDILVDDWNRVAGADVYYVGKGFGSFLKMLRVITASNFSCIYFNSFLSLKFSFVPLFFSLLFSKSRIIVAPRGELDDGALSIKPTKKRIFIWFVKLLNFYRRVSWHATSNEEVRSIRSKMDVSANSITFAPNLFSLMPMANQKFDDEGVTLRLVYVSRITPKKNLLAALKALVSIKIPYRFEIYGPVDDLDYWEECLPLINEAGEEKIQWMGEVVPEQVANVFRRSDLFVFPTLGENFGHVLVEALGNSCPVLVSDKTPWSSVAESGAGYVVKADDIEAIRSSIVAHFEAGVQSRLMMRKCAWNFVKEYLDSSDLVEQSKCIFLNESKWNESGS